MSNPGRDRSEAVAAALVGAWRLVRTEQRFADGTVRPSPIYGPNGIGYLVYAATGEMSVVMVDPDQASWASAEAPSDEELRDRFAHFVAYAGRYTVREAGTLVDHDIELHLTPNLTGIATRRIELEGSRLVLRPLDAELPPGMVEYTFEWARCGPSVRRR